MRRNSCKEPQRIALRAAGDVLHTQRIPAKALLDQLWKEKPRCGEGTLHLQKSTQPLYLSKPESTRHTLVFQTVN